jgi:hypothetical protein
MGDTKVLTRPEVAELLDRVAALAPGTADALDRDTACAVLRQLHELQRQRSRGPFFATCPYCRWSFDIAHSRFSAGAPPPPSRHPDPIAAADSAAGAREVARALGQALLWGNQDHSEDFWVRQAQVVLWPLLLVAHATGGDMESVLVQGDPDRMAETVASVAKALGELAAGPDAEAARSDWDSLRFFDVRTRRAVLTYAFRIVAHWYRPTLPSRRPVVSLSYDRLP